MPMYAFIAPIQPGKTEEFRAFAKQLQTEKKAEYAASRKRVGVMRESLFHQKTPMGDFAVVVWETSGNPEAAFGKIFESQDPFDQWFVKRIGEIHGVTQENMTNQPMNELVMDWKA